VRSSRANLTSSFDSLDRCCAWRNTSRIGALPVRPRASRCSMARIEVRPVRRACSNACSNVSPSTKDAQSIKVRVAEVYAIPSTVTRSARPNLQWWTTTPGDDRLVGRLTATSSELGVGSPSCSSRALTRCDMAELSPAHIVVASAACRQVTGGPATR
jgi:hypothetical protein